MDEKRMRLECMVHSGVRAELDDLKQSDRDQWDKIGFLQTSKASSSQMRWVIGIFLMISIAVVGFLWRTQVSGTDTIIKKIEVSDIKREEMGQKMNEIKDRVNELCWTVEDIQKKK